MVKSRLHFLNVGQGSCIVIQHASERVTVYDICGGNLEEVSRFRRAVLMELSGARGNFRMCEHPTHPITFLQTLGVRTAFRFILSHPDMDHLDGFDRFMNDVGTLNFWDAGVRRPKPDLEGSPYSEEDWNRYCHVRDKKEAGVTVVTPRAGSHFSFANQGDGGSKGGDGLYVLSPDQTLVDEVNESENWNDGSYLLLYRSVGGRVVIPGDSHDRAWADVLEHYEEDVSNCALLIAPHHGRKSGRSYAFLDALQPQLTFFGCAPSTDLAYDAWRNRSLPYITSNQAGSITAEFSDGEVAVFVENETFAQAAGGDPSSTNSLGFHLLTAYTTD